MSSDANFPIGGIAEKKNADPVLPDQSGRLTALDPLGTNARQDVLVRQKAYEIYERRGRVDGHALDHWLEAEGQVLAAD